MPTPTVLTTESVLVSITLTLLAPQLVTKARVPAALSATPYGRWPTATVARTEREAGSTTRRVSSRFPAT